MLAILQQFPPVQFAFAYGSGVFKQPGLYADKVHPSEGPMTDFIFAVDDPIAWHRENIARHGSHYSGMKWFGPSAIHKIAEHVGAGVYFNTLVPWSTGMIKYGVVKLATLQRDLLSWDSLYIAGRLHKAVTILTPPSSPPSSSSSSSASTTVAAAQQLNLESALRVGLLLVEEERFSLRQLLRVVCGLSYEGDVRIGLAEDSSKVEKIVQENMNASRYNFYRMRSYDRLVELYTPAIQTAETDWNVLHRQRGQDQSFTFDCSPLAKAPLLAALPAALLSKMATSVGRSAPVAALSDHAVRATLARDLAGFSQCSQLLRQSVAVTVRASSLRQALLGTLSAGVLKSVQYTWRKYNKKVGGGVGGGYNSNINVL